MKIGLLLGMITSSVSVFLMLTGILNNFELKSYDMFSRLLNPERPYTNIVIIEIDQPSIEMLNTEQAIDWPWPREIYAAMVEYISDADAVLIDMLYTEPSFYGVEDDKRFAQAMDKAGNVYLPVFLTNNKKSLSPSEERFVQRFALRERVNDLMAFTSAVTPVDVLKDSVAGTGNVMVKPDDDGVYRKVPLLFSVRDHVIPNFVVGHLLNRERLHVTDGAIYSGDKELPLQDGSLYLRFYTEGKPFNHIPAANVLAAYVEHMAGGAPELTREFFKGKTVFIGPTAAGLYDLKPTSVSSLSTGVIVHATALDNLINRTYIIPVPAIFSALLIVLLCTTSSLFVLRHHSIVENLSYFTVSLAAVIGIEALLFRGGLYLNITSPLYSLILSFIIASAYSYATEGKERRFIKNTFSQYMDSKVVAHILDNPALIRPGGQKKEISMFFVDIAGFTTMAEKLPPRQTARILHSALNTFTEVIIRNGGVIDKYMGDAIMAIWGAPLATTDDKKNACKAAIQCSAALDMLNEGFVNEGLNEINVRIGLHTGEALVGNLGSDRLFDYTAIGDNVNLASRLEGVNKVFMTRIIASEDTLKDIDPQFLTRELGLIEVKGKARPVRIFELISDAANAASDSQELVSMFEKGLALFREKQWQEAISTFDGILALSPEDGPAIFYRKWCLDLSDMPVLTYDWDIIKMTVK